ncbi:spermidine synthase [Pyrolobus fumarii 1A]|uniref:Polyamine aminopropyltransferase n=1 Tax=Pyrolobus fumarii (strain DSM 11204 / 1A) TaxID=694429 RepID=G0EH56_PYRF1|nr:spermidine synthase [Pyrolobus fumarii 1A]
MCVNPGMAVIIGNELLLMESVGHNVLMGFKVKRVLYQAKSPYQYIMVAEIEDFGKALVLDGLIQSSERTEYIYHESLVHPAMVLHPNPRRVLILGGGEGATLREVLKHKTVEKAVMVDIDEMVVEAAKKYLQEWHQGAFDDPRSEVVIEDGMKYVEECLKRGEKFDVIIMDLTDPYGPEVSKGLYSREFFSKLSSILSDDGVLVTQAGNSFFYRDVYDMVLENIRSVFKHVEEYMVWVPEFGYANNFILASKVHDPRSLKAEDVNARLQERGVKTKLFNGEYYEALIKMPIIRG